MCSSRPVRARGLKLKVSTELSRKLKSRPVRARGLKHPKTAQASSRLPSRPVRARGLKQHPPAAVTAGQDVAPRAGAWIETWCRSWARWPSSKSRPVRARGLKLCHLADDFGLPLSRPVRARGLKRGTGGAACRRHSVAPLAGAWIESPRSRRRSRSTSSGPVRARGLKRGWAVGHDPAQRRAPCGRVD